MLDDGLTGDDKPEKNELPPARMLLHTAVPNFSAEPVPPAKTKVSDFSPSQKEKCGRIKILAHMRAVGVSVVSIVH